MLVNAASLLSIREVGSSNPRRAIGKLLSFLFLRFTFFLRNKKKNNADCNKINKKDYGRNRLKGDIFWPFIIKA